MQVISCQLGLSPSWANFSHASQDTETMLIRLWVEGYISLHFSAGMYQTYVVSKVVPF